MTNYDRMKRKRLGDILVDDGLATEEIVIAGLQEQQRSGRLLSEILLEQRQVNEHDLARSIVEHYQVPYVELKNYTIHKDLIQTVPAALLNRARVVPLDKYGKQICFACQEIPPKEMVDELRRHATGGVFFFIASAMEIKRALEDYASVGKAAAAAPAAPGKQAAAGKPAAAGKQAAASKQPAAKQPVPADADENTAWKDLFDAANESILSDIKVRDE
jgi:hypothetical protein